MVHTGQMTPAKCRHLIKTYGPCPTDYTHDDLERILDVIYGMYSHVSSMTELCQIVVSDPFDRSEAPRRIRVIDLAAWLEALVS